MNSANANVPKGHFSDGFHLWEVGANDQMFKAKDYRPLIVAYNNGAPVRLSDVAEVVDSVEDLRNVGIANGEPSVIVRHQPAAGREHHRHGGSHSRGAAAAEGRHSALHQV